jgi:anti-sigma factor RsiW
MAKLIRLTPELRADFVAYLDGELDEQAAARIETVIAQSEVARSDMEALAQTYELLDVLDRPQAAEDFAERTMATIRVDELRPDPRDTWWYRTARQGGVIAVWGAALLVTGLLGFLATNRWVQTPADLLVKELPLVEDLDLYTEVGSIDFLERLSTQDALLEEMRPPSEGAAE